MFTSEHLRIMTLQDVTFDQVLDCPNCGMETLEILGILAYDINDEDFVIDIELREVKALCGICNHEIAYDIKDEEKKEKKK